MNVGVRVKLRGLDRFVTRKAIGKIEYTLIRDHGPLSKSLAVISLWKKKKAGVQDAAPFESSF